MDVDAVMNISEVSWLDIVPWKYLELPHPFNMSDYIGFVYEITEKDTGMKYIGIKKFWKKNKKKEKVQSDWRTYNSSCKQLALKMKRDPDNYEKTIVHLCKSITEMKVAEACKQLDYYRAGRWDELYNQMIHLRVRLRKEKDKSDQNI